MYISILGRQPALGIAELERRFGDVSWLSSTSAQINTTEPIDIQTLGGSQKIGQIVAELPAGDWLTTSKKIVQAYTESHRSHEGKLTVGLSAYGFAIPPKLVQKTGITLKQKLKSTGVSVRLIPNTDTALTTATSHHNKLGLSGNKIEIIAIRSSSGKIVIAQSIGAQNITSYAKRDQGRPKRDAFVGMLPPKLAQIMINLTAVPEHSRILDPFCGTGVVLQEAALMHHPVYGTDLSDKMIDFSTINLEWLASSHHLTIDATLAQGDVMTTTWQHPIGGVTCETYLGQPFSAPPSPAKLREVRGNCNHIIGAFLTNISKQLTRGTPLCIGVPAWRAQDGSFTHLPLVRDLASYGFEQVTFTTVKPNELLYYRDTQVVARELLVLIKT